MEEIDRHIARLDAGGETAYEAAQALASLGAPAVPRLEQALSHQWVGLRWRAAAVLGRIGTPEAAQVLCQALRHWDANVRREAAKALGRLQLEVAIRPLCRALRDRHLDVRQEAAAALAASGEPAIEPLCEALEDWRRDVRQQAAEVLCRLAHPAAVERLCRALQRHTVSDRRRVIEALGQVGDPAAVGTLCGILAEPDLEEAAAAAKSLGEIGDARAVAPLAAAWRRGYRLVSRRAIAALGAIGGRQAVVVLCDALASFDLCEEERREIEAVVIRHGAAAVELLTPHLQDSAVEVRLSACQILGAWGDTRALEPLLGLLSHAVPETRRKAVGAILLLGEPGTAARLALLLEDPDSTVRRQAVRALTELGWQPLTLRQRVLFALARCDYEAAVADGDAAVDLLCELLRGPDRLLRRDAAHALAFLPRRDLLPVLRQRVERRFGEEDLEARAAIIAAMARIEAATAHLQRHPRSIDSDPASERLPRAGQNVPTPEKRPRLEP